MEMMDVCPPKPLDIDNSLTNQARHSVTDEAQHGDRVGRSSQRKEHVPRIRSHSRGKNLSIPPDGAATSNGSL